MMIRYNLNNEFKLVPEGTRTLEITKAEAKPSGKPTTIIINYKDVETGGTIINIFNLSVSGAVYALGLTCKFALGLPDEGEIDTAKDLPKLVGKKVICEVVHTEGTQPREDGTLPKFANISKIISGVDETTTTSTMSARASIPTMDDLD